MREKETCAWAYACYSVPAIRIFFVGNEPCFMLLWPESFSRNYAWQANSGIVVSSTPTPSKAAAKTSLRRSKLKDALEAKTRTTAGVPAQLAPTVEASTTSSEPSESSLESDISPFSKELCEGTKHVDVASAVGFHEALLTPRKSDPVADLPDGSELERPAETPKRPSRVSFANRSHEQVDFRCYEAFAEAGTCQLGNFCRDTQFLAAEKFRIFSEMHSPNLNNTTFATDATGDVLVRPTPGPSQEDGDAMDDGDGCCSGELVKVHDASRSPEVSRCHQIKIEGLQPDPLNTCHKAELLKELCGLECELHIAGCEYRQLTSSCRQLEPDFMALDDSALAQELAAAKADVTKVSEDTVAHAILESESMHQPAVSVEASLVILPNNRAVNCHDHETGDIKVDCRGGSSASATQAVSPCVADPQVTAAQRGPVHARAGRARDDDYQEVLRRLTPRVVAVTPLRRRLACSRLDEVREVSIRADQDSRAVISCLQMVEGLQMVNEGRFDAQGGEDCEQPARGVHRESTVYMSAFGYFKKLRSDRILCRCFLNWGIACWGRASFTDPSIVSLHESVKNSRHSSVDNPPTNRAVTSREGGELSVAPVECHSSRPELCIAADVQDPGGPCSQARSHENCSDMRVQQGLSTSIAIDEMYISHTSRQMCRSYLVGRATPSYSCGETYRANNRVLSDIQGGCMQTFRPAQPCSELLNHGRNHVAGEALPAPGSRPACFRPSGQFQLKGKASQCEWLLGDLGNPSGERLQTMTPNGSIHNVNLSGCANSDNTRFDFSVWGSQNQYPLLQSQTAHRREQASFGDISRVSRWPRSEAWTANYTREVLPASCSGTEFKERHAIGADEMAYVSPALAAADVWQRKNDALSARVRQVLGVSGAIGRAGAEARIAASDVTVTAMGGYQRRSGLWYNLQTGLPNVCVFPQSRSAGVSGFYKGNL